MSGSGISWAICKSAPRSCLYSPYYLSTFLWQTSCRPCWSCCRPVMGKSIQMDSLGWNDVHRWIEVIMFNLTVSYRLLANTDSEVSLCVTSNLFLVPCSFSHSSQFRLHFLQVHKTLTTISKLRLCVYNRYEPIQSQFNHLAPVKWTKLNWIVFYFSEWPITTADYTSNVKQLHNHGHLWKCRLRYIGPS